MLSLRVNMLAFSWKVNVLVRSGITACARTSAVFRQGNKCYAGITQDLEARFY
jgi:hypothetical protein